MNPTLTLLNIIQPTIEQRLREKLGDDFNDNVFNPNYSLMVNEDVITRDIDIGVKASGMIRLCEQHKDCNHENFDIKTMGFKIRLSREMIEDNSYGNLFYVVDSLADSILRYKLLPAKEGECSRCNYQLRKLKE